MLRAWRSPEFRPTMDIDMLGRTRNDEANIVAQIRDIIAVDVAPDGMRFDPATVQSERITEDADYKGIRIRFRGILDSARVGMQIDIGFSDVVYPEVDVRGIVVPEVADEELLALEEDTIDADDVIDDEGEMDETD
jgi:hypothetical protein